MEIPLGSSDVVRTVVGILAPEPLTKDRRNVNGTRQANVLVGGDR
jgi:hypothetical protein